MTAAVVLLNPRAAGGRAAALRDPLERWLRAHAPDVSLTTSGSIDHAQAHLRSLAIASRVIVVGGDGTLHHLLAPALERGHTLGLVPLGSGNDTAHAVGLFAMPWSNALAHALSAPSVAIDTGEVAIDGRRTPFISSLCAGFDASICARVIGAPRFLRGLPRYLWGTLGELARLRRWDLRITLDGELHHSGSALFASTCNTPTFGSGMPAVPQARVDDGRLDLLLAGPFGRAGALRMLPRLLAGSRSARRPGVDPVLSIAADHQRDADSAGRRRRAAACASQLPDRGAAEVTRLRRRSPRRGARHRIDHQAARR